VLTRIEPSLDAPEVPRRVGLVVAPSVSGVAVGVGSAAAVEAEAVAAQVIPVKH
jgi:hypothetical protein